MFTSHTSQRGSFVLPGVKQVAMTTQQKIVDAAQQHASYMAVDDFLISPNASGAMNGDILTGAITQVWSARFGDIPMVNQVVNPDPGMDVSNWHGVGVTLAVDSGISMFAGTSYVRGTVDGSTSEPTLSLSNQPCNPGQLVEISCYARSTHLSGIKTFRLEVNFFKAGVPVGTFPGDVIASDAADEWVRVKATVTVPAGATDYTMQISPSSPTDVQAGDTIYMGFPSTSTTVDAPFLVGGMESVAWSGTVGKSSSSYVPSWIPATFPPTLELARLMPDAYITIFVGDVDLSTAVYGDEWINAQGLLYVLQDDWEIVEDPGVPQVVQDSQQAAEDAAQAITDATVKADEARDAAIAAAALDATAKADQAEADAAEAAALDAQQKADAAQAAAEAAAQAYADAQVAGASDDVLAAAQADAQEKADLAQQAAIDAAALDATAKAETAEANATSTAAADATAKADAAQQAAIDALSPVIADANTAANDAMTAAQAAQATADGAIRTYYQSTPPWPDGSSQPSESLGDMWYDSDNGQAYRWNGTSWTVIEDNQIAAAIAAAADAQATADGKITAYYQPTAPLAGDVNDLWYDTDDGNKPYYCSDDSPLTWTPVRDASIATGDAATLSSAQADATAKANAAIAAAMLATNKISNPTRTNSTTNWTTSGTATLSMTTLDYGGITIPVMKSTSSTSTQNYSNYFDVDPTKAYEVRFSYQDTAVAPGPIQFYVGLNVLNAAGTNAGVYTINAATGKISAATTTNFYFVYEPSANAVPGLWKDYVLYIFPFGTTADKMKGFGSVPAGTTYAGNAMFTAEAAKTRVRFLNWTNTTSRDLYVANVSVQEISLATLAAQQSATAAGESATAAGATADQALSDANNVMLNQLNNEVVSFITGSGVKITFSDVAPVDPANGDVWYASQTDDTYLTYTWDDDAGVWRSIMLSDQSFNVISASKIGAGAIAAEVTLSGRFSTPGNGARVEISGDDGVVVYQDDGTPTTTLGSDGVSTFKGDVVADTLTVMGNMALRGQTNEISQNSVLTLQSSVTGSATPPNMSTMWPSVVLSNVPTSFYPGEFYSMTQDYDGVMRVLGYTDDNVNYDGEGVASSWNIDGSGARIDMGYNRYVDYTYDSAFAHGSWKIEGAVFVKGDPAVVSCDIMFVVSGLRYLSYESDGGPTRQTISYYGSNSSQSPVLATKSPNMLVGEYDAVNKKVVIREFDSTKVAGPNLVTNGTFETDLTGWAIEVPNLTIARATDQKKSGTASMKVTGNTAGGYAYTTLSTVPNSNRVYAMTYSIYSEVARKVWIGTTAADGSGGFGVTQDVPAGVWTDFTTNYANRAGMARLAIGNLTDTGDFYVDDVAFKERNGYGSPVSTYTTAKVPAELVGPLGGILQPGTYGGSVSVYPVLANGMVYLFRVASPYDVVDSFPAPSVNTLGLAWDGTDFRTFTANEKVYTHPTTTAIPPEVVWGGFTWKDTDPTDGLHESALSPMASFFPAKRAGIGMTSPQINDTGGVDDPDSIGLFLGQGHMQPPLTSMYHQITVPSSTGIVTAPVFTFSTTNYNPPDPDNNPAAFPLTVPAEIRSTNGETVISADGSVKFGATEIAADGSASFGNNATNFYADGRGRVRGLEVYAIQDANLQAGNLPPLRIGDIMGYHLRIDGNEILAMSGDATQGQLYLNQGGQTNFGTVNAQLGLLAPKNIQIGNLTSTALANNGTVSIPVTFSPAFVNIPAVTGSTTSYRYSVGASGITRTGCNILISNYSGSAGATVDCTWMAIGM